jgi:hypothetical protein
MISFLSSLDCSLQSSESKKAMLLKYISNTFAVQTDSIKKLDSHAKGNDWAILYSAWTPTTIPTGTWT